mgnify:CR=1 FL=1
MKPVVVLANGGYGAANRGSASGTRVHPWRSGRVRREEGRAQDSHLLNNAVFDPDVFQLAQSCACGQLSELGSSSTIHPILVLRGLVELHTQFANITLF